MRRYYDDPTDKSKAPDAVRALHKLANLYWNTSHEYGVTYYTLQAAISIAEAEGLNDLLPYLYLDLAAMWDQQSLAFDQGNAQAQQYMHAAYNTAIKSGHTEALPAVAVNMCIAEHFHPDIRYGAELESIENTRLPATAPGRDVSLLFIAGHKAMKEGKPTEARRYFRAAAAKEENGVDPLNAKLSAMFMEADAVNAVEGGKHARAVLLNYLRQARAKDHKGYIQAISRMLCGMYEQAQMPDSANYYRLQWLSQREEMRQQNRLSSSVMAYLNEFPTVNEKLRLTHQASQKRERWLILAGSLGAVLLIALSFCLWAWRIQRRNIRTLYAQNKILLAQADDLSAMRGELQKQSDEATYPPPTKKKVKYETSAIDSEMSGELYSRLLHIMDTDPAIYNANFRLTDLASLAGIAPRYVSQIINENSSDNFNQFLNRYRVREAQRRLCDRPQYGNLTTEAVGTSVGFQSRSSFIHTFKRYTGLTPAQFRNMNDAEERQGSTLVAF